MDVLVTLHGVLIGKAYGEVGAGKNKDGGNPECGAE
jgi:hypothetical protein